MSIDVNHREFDHGTPATVGAVAVGAIPPAVGPAVTVGAVTVGTPVALLREMYLWE